MGLGPGSNLGALAIKAYGSGFGYFESPRVQTQLTGPTKSYAAGVRTLLRPGCRGSG